MLWALPRLRQLAATHSSLVPTQLCNRLAIKMKEFDIYKGIVDALTKYISMLCFLIYKGVTLHRDHAEVRALPRPGSRAALPRA